MLSFIVLVLVLTAVILSPAGSILVHQAIRDRRGNADHIRLYGRPRPKGYYTPQDQIVIRGRQTELSFDALHFADSGIKPISYSTEPGEEELRLKQQEAADRTRRDYLRGIEVASPHRLHAG